MHVSLRDMNFGQIVTEVTDSYKECMYTGEFKASASGDEGHRHQDLS